MAAAVGRLVAVVAIGATGAAALAATGESPVVATSATRPLTAVVAAPHPPPPEGRTQQVRHDVVRKLPAPAAPRHKAAAPAARHHVTPTGPWLPTGTGMWIYQWDETNGGRAASVVAQARSVGLSTLYLRTGSTWDGFTGEGALQELLAATRGTSLHVVAWDFPRLRHPWRDARRLARAARVGRQGDGPHVAAVAPDIETPAEGTFNAAWRVRAYLHALHRHLPKGVSVLGTVPWPSSYRIADYPYHAVASRSDALVPMAYWYNNPPAVVTARSMSYLKRFHKPVQPVGQGYDGKIDVPSLRHNHLAREVPRFFRTARAHGAHAVSLWSWQAARAGPSHRGYR